MSDSSNSSRDANPKSGTDAGPDSAANSAAYSAPEASSALDRYLQKNQQNVGPGESGSRSGNNTSNAASGNSSSGPGASYITDAAKSIPNLNLDLNSGVARYELAGFWRRGAAVTIDSMIMKVLTVPLSALIVVITRSASVGTGTEATITNVFSLIEYFALTYFYTGWFYKNKGATPGKMLFDLKVLDEKTGKYLDYNQTMKREILGKICSSITLMIGYLMAAFRDDHKALHDIIASTRVVREKKS
jgi:uncharacterized RDD family membrane protein YckC